MKIYRPFCWIPEGRSFLPSLLVLVLGLLPFIPCQIFAISASPANPAHHIERGYTRKSFTIPLRPGAYSLRLGSQDSSGNPGKGAQEDATFRKVDRADSRSTAKAILTAYKRKDLAVLAEYSTASNKEILEKIAAQGEDHPRYQSIFSGWRWDAVQGWQGKLGETRYKQIAGAPVAQIQLADLGGGKIAVVTLTWEKGQWCFDDINRSDRQRFEKGNPEAPTDLH